MFLLIVRPELQLTREWFTWGTNPSILVCKWRVEQTQWSESSQMDTIHPRSLQGERIPFPGGRGRGDPSPLSNEVRRTHLAITLGDISQWLRGDWQMRQSHGHKGNACMVQRSLWPTGQSQLSLVLTKGQEGSSRKKQILDLKKIIKIQSRSYGVRMCSISGFIWQK